MWVKICANTTLEDALAAVAYGADALGFVFAASPRHVTAAQVRIIADRLPSGIERVGVFAGSTADEIVDVVQEAGLTGVQLHGGLNAGLAAELKQRLGPQVKLIQTIAWRLDDKDAHSEVSAQLDQARSAAVSEYVLIDAKVRGASGGLGVSYPWQEAQDLFLAERGLKLIVAGGLRPENVADAVRTLAPWGIDVASGVEREPGRKDHERVRLFIENARRA